MEESSTKANTYLYIAGRQPVGEFLQYVRTTAERHEAAAEAGLVEQWRQASRRIRQLQQLESGCADNPTLEPLPRGMQPTADTALTNPSIQRTFQHFALRWAMVPLDNLVVYQNYIDLGYAEALRRSIPPHLSDIELLRFVIGEDLPVAPIRSARVSDTAFQFWSVSKDLRCTEIALLDPSNLAGYSAKGRPAAVVAVFLGFSANYLSAVQVANRLILTNGSHRAYVLRELGFNRVPCLVAQVAEEEIELLSLNEIRQNAGTYLKAPRPPLFKDYFDEQLRTLIQVGSSTRMLQVSCAIQQSRAP